MKNKLKIKSKVKLLKDIRKENGKLVEKGEIDYIDKVDERGYWLRDNGVYVMNELKDQYIEEIPEREEIVEFIESNYKEFVKTLIMMELNIKDEEVLEKMYNEYMERDGMGLINDGFEAISYKNYNNYYNTELEL